MDIETSSNTVTIRGNIKTIGDYQDIKSTLGQVVENHNKVTLNIKDSISITSSVIGYLNKLVLKDGIDISILVGNEQLKELFDELNLSSMFKVRKV